MMFVSSDDADCLEIAERFAATPVKRDPKLAQIALVSLM